MGAGFTAALTIYLLRAIGAAHYGTFAVAVSVGALVLLPSDFGLSAAVARFLAERRQDAVAASSVLARGLELKVASGTIATVALFALAPVIARAYGQAGMTWPLRWIAIAIFGQGLLYFLSANFAAVRNAAKNLKMVTFESATEFTASLALVLAGTGVAGAALGRAIGYTVGAIAGLLLARSITGSARAAWVRRRTVSPGSIGRYAGAMMLVDAAHTAIVQVDVLLIGGVLGVVAAGPFAAVIRLFTFLTYLGNSAAAGVAPRLSRSAGVEPDAKTFGLGLRYVVVLQGVLLAPLVVWAKPISAVVLGAGYSESVGVMRALAPTVVLGALAPVLALGANYLGEARRRVPLMLGILLFGLVLTWVLLRAVGVVGAAVADDLVVLAHVISHLWICARRIAIDVWGLLLTSLRTVIAGAVMGLVLAAVGRDQLSPLAWLLGLGSGTAAFLAALILTGELTRGELRSLRRGAQAMLARTLPARRGL